MSNNRPHPLLEQVPLTVSPFVRLPTAPTLSYNYKSIPSTLPPSLVEPHGTAGAEPSAEKVAFVVSPNGHAAHPDDIITSCRELYAHLARMQEDANTQLRAWEERMRERDLAEKRRVAPGWLDREERLLEPERAVVEGVQGLRLWGQGQQGRQGRDGQGEAQARVVGHHGGNGNGNGNAGDKAAVPEGISEMAAEGEELDRVFGGTSMG